MAHPKNSATSVKNELEEVLERTRDASASSVDMKQVRNAMKRARLAIIFLERSRDEANLRKKIDGSIANAEMRSDLIDREANAARREERQRILFERAQLAAKSETASSAQTPAVYAQESHERSLGYSRYVEAALASLCPHYPNRPNMGCSAINGSARID